MKEESKTSEDIRIVSDEIHQEPDKPPPVLLSTSPPAVINILSNQILKSESMNINKQSLEYVKDLDNFVSLRMKDKMKLNVAELKDDPLTDEGWYQEDWCQRKLGREEISAALESMASLHAAGLAYRMSTKNNFEKHYPCLSRDLFTSHVAKELIAKHIDSYLHSLSSIPGADKVVGQLRKIQPNVFQHLVALRRPNDELGARFSTMCHGDLWQGNLMFRRDADDKLECCLNNFKSACFLSPATDLAHLILTSCSADLVMTDWDSIVEEYYNKFNRTLCQFGLVLRHLGTNYNHFKLEVERSLAGQFLIVAVAIPIIAMFGPQEFLRSTRRRSAASFGRENTIRHLIQMMSIVELESEAGIAECCEDGLMENSTELFLGDENLRNYVTQLLMIGQDLNILEAIRQDLRPRSGSWVRTKQTTAKYKPTYRDNETLRSSVIGTCG